MSDSLPGSVLPPYPSRWVVRHGYARVIRGGKGIAYNWKKIRDELWLVRWRGFSLVEFCAAFDISYKSAKNCGYFSAEDKRKVLSAGGDSYLRAAMARISVLRAADGERDAAALSRAIGMFREVGELLLMSCHANLAVDGPDGSLLPNQNLSPASLARYAQTADRALSVFRQVLDLERAVVPAATAERRVTPVPALPPPSSPVAPGNSGGAA